jgi:hypothetical protein
MSQVDIEQVDPDTLVDISTVTINPALPHTEKMEQYVKQIGNPYCFRSGSTPVRVRFVRPDKELSQSLGGYLSRLTQR